MSKVFKDITVTAMYHRGFCEAAERWIRCCGISPDSPIVDKMVMEHME